MLTNIYVRHRSVSAVSQGRARNESGKVFRDSVACCSTRMRRRSTPHLHLSLRIPSSLRAQTPNGEQLAYTNGASGDVYMTSEDDVVRENHHKFRRNPMEVMEEYVFGNRTRSTTIASVDKRKSRHNLPFLSVATHKSQER